MKNSLKKFEKFIITDSKKRNGGEVCGDDGVCCYYDYCGNGCGWMTCIDANGCQWQNEYCIEES